MRQANGGTVDVAQRIVPLDFGCGEPAAFVAMAKIVKDGPSQGDCPPSPRLRVGAVPVRSLAAELVSPG